MFGHIGAAEFAAAVVSGKGRFIPFCGRAIPTRSWGLNHNRMVRAEGDVVWFVG